jgi:uncharacterized coiled-coil protein SlyX
MEGLEIQAAALEEAIDGNAQALTAWESFLEAVASLVDDLAARLNPDQPCALETA